MRTLVFSPHVPLALWVALAVAAAALLVWYALASRPRLTAGRHLLVISLMALGFVLPLIILLNPTWLETIPPPAGKPLLTLLVDTSQSMQTSDASGGVTRIEAAQKLADEVRDRLEARYDVRLLTFAGDADELLAIGNEQLAAEGELTDLGSALLAGIAENRPQGQAMLLLSDGIHNAGSTASVLSASGKARAMDVPIFAHTLGGKLDVKNLKVQLRSPQELAFTGQELAIEAQLSHLGLAGATVEVGLWHEGNRIDQNSARRNGPVSL